MSGRAFFTHRSVCFDGERNYFVARRHVAILGNFELGGVISECGGPGEGGTKVAGCASVVNGRVPSSRFISLESRYRNRRQGDDHLMRRASRLKKSCVSGGVEHAADALVESLMPSKTLKAAIVSKCMVAELVKSGSVNACAWSRVD